MLEGALREILSELDIEIVGKSASGWINCRCPFAEFKHISGRDRSPDFFVKIDPVGLSGFHCFACKSRGRVSSLVRQLEHWRGESYGGLAIRADLAEMPDSFEEWGSRQIDEVDPDPINKAAYLSMFPLAFEHEHSRDYLLARGISEGTSELLGLQYDDEECRILFPVFDHKIDLYGFSGRSILTDAEIDSLNFDRGRRGFRAVYSKVRDYNGLPKSKLILGEHMINTSLPNFTLEGLFGFAHCIEIGAQSIVNVIATMGASMSEYQRDLLSGYGLPTWLAYDNDASGEKGIFGETLSNGQFKPGAYALLKDHVPTFIPYWPEGIDDPDFLTFEHIEEMIGGDSFVPDC